MNRLVSSKHLEAVSDLTLSAPIKQGFIDAFEAVTYETRLSKLLEALFKIRSTAREHSEIKPFVDTAERIQSLLDFRLAIVEGEPRRLLLSATFDRAFEPYMRLIWYPLGPLLDVIFCNCEGYVSATDHSFEEYLAWVRSAQVNTDYFYSASGHSVNDMKYLLKIERLDREDPSRSSTLVYVKDPQTEASEVRRHNRWDSDFLGMEALIGLYRLTDFYPPDQPHGDGRFLRLAAQQLLEGWLEKGLPKDWAERLIPEQLSWFKQGLPEQNKEEQDLQKKELINKEKEKEKEAKVAKQERLEFKPEDVQGGIVYNYGRDPNRGIHSPKDKPVRLGALLLMRIIDPEPARRYIRCLPVTSGGRRQYRGTIFLNLGFTCSGLENIGVSREEIDRFPQEFREGMEERAGLLGDLRYNHPRNWKLPERIMPIDGAGPASAQQTAPPPVGFSEVDFVLQLRTTRQAPEGVDPDEIRGDPRHPLHRTVRWIVAAGEQSGVRLLAIQPMRRADPGNDEHPKDYFGFRDGFSQPEPVDHIPVPGTDQVARGELFWGYSNDRTDAPPPPDPLLDNGTFLVVRKLHQNVRLLHDTVDATATSKVRSRRILSKMMGRTPSGRPMVSDSTPYGNDFDYQGDEHGVRCPFQAHIRRANPRVETDAGVRRRTPRILRRGLSFGPPPPESGPDDENRRGVVFMAYNASIAEQYEVIQRWLNGGNSTGVGSWQSDPLTGLFHDETEYPPADKMPKDESGSDALKPHRTFRFRYYSDASNDDRKFATMRMRIPGPFVELEWGTYLFVPSMAAIKRIGSISPVDAQAQRARARANETRRGERIVARLLELAGEGAGGRAAAGAQWKAYLEDFGSKDPGERGDGPAVWAAIRACHGGALRVPYGSGGPCEEPRDVVLVASKDLVMRVFRDEAENYSMCGQMARMKQSFGPIFLGLDGGKEYDEKSQINLPIWKIEEEEAFNFAYGLATKLLERELQLFCSLFGPEDEAGQIGRWGELDLRRDFVTKVLAGICNYWFGIPDTLQVNGHPTPKPPTADECDPANVEPGGWGWSAVRKPRCPGDYLATSRYCFYPDPVPRVQAYGKAQGQALHKAVLAHFKTITAPQAKIAKAMAGFDVYKDDPDEFARTLIGVMTGFLPPADATLRWTLYEWLEEKLFWRIQHDLRIATGTPWERASSALTPPLIRAMQKRPSPDMLWRTAVRTHQLGEVEVVDGDRVFIGIVSAMAEDAEAGTADVYPVFGGRRDWDEQDGWVDSPRHACPAYKFAMGTMMGILAALMDKVTVQALPAPLIVKISDRTPCPKPPPPAPPGTAGSPPPREESSSPVPPPPLDRDSGPEAEASPAAPTPEPSP